VSGYDRIIPVFGQSDGLIPEATDRFLPDDCPSVCCLYLALVAPDSRYRDTVLSQPRGRRSPLLPSGHVLIFSFKPVRRVHLDFAMIRWKFCASLFSSCATATLTAVAKRITRYRKTRVNHSILSGIAWFRKNVTDTRKIIIFKIENRFFLYTQEN